jgi:hypothetical protein
MNILLRLERPANWIRYVFFNYALAALAKIFAGLAKIMRDKAA